MSKSNCWEYKNCGRQPGGLRVKELGVCPATTEEKAHGINGGKNGGRCCWVIAGTFCNGQVQGVYAKKLVNCMKCDFYKEVLKEEGQRRMDSTKILAIINS